MRPSGRGHHGEPTPWERIAETRWGRYISDLERGAIEQAASRFGAHERVGLEIGCEGGRWVQLLVDRGWSMMATEIDQVAAAAGHARVPSAAVVLVAEDGRHLPCRDHAVSLVVCIEVPQAVLSERFGSTVARSLAPGGLLVAIMWNTRSARGLFARLTSRLRREGEHPFYRMPYSSWRRRLEASGLEVVAERGLCWFPFPRQSNSRLVPAAALLERLTHLDRCVRASPWILVTARRRDAV